jgi:regulator of cell morphogenesis and NO signaling
MTNTSLQTIGQLAAQRPEALGVLERHGVDYCCGGERNIEDACVQAGADPQTVLAEIDRATAASDGSEKRDWLSASLTELCDHIEQTHHAFLREQLPFLTDLFEKVIAAHGEGHPELAEAREVFGALRAELEPHMFKEERILFPAIRRLESAGAPVSFPFGTVQNPIGVMEDEHAAAGEALRRLRELTDGYQSPDDACNAYRGLLEILQRLEVDLHEHIHKENNILFPRAAELEGRLAGS